MEQPQQHKGGAVPAPAAAAANGAGAGAAELIGYVDVHVRSARDIQNICIYHKQDVYARLSLPGDGAPAASTQVVNGGGRNPVFDQSLRLGVRAGDVDAALRCEVWMLSRVKNYLQDQLLGFALVPLPEVVAADGGTLARDFPLTTSDLFQTPSGFLQLELSYIGVVPEVVPISPTPKPALADPDEEEPGNNAADGVGNGKEYEKIEFPDLNLVEENQIMVSEYTRLPCAAVETQSCDSLLTSEHDDGATALSRDAAVRLVESFSTDNSTADSVGAFQSDTPVSSVSTTEFPATPQSNSSSEPSGNAHSSAYHKAKAASETADAEVDSSRTVQEVAAANSPCAASEAAVHKPVISVNIEQEVKVDGNQIMDMYMKSMQQFTDSLAKMKLPALDIDNGSSGMSSPAAATPSADSTGADSTAVKKPTAAGQQEKPSPKVFYGSRAFF
uniref:C2 domain containing protein n=1 Tax=Zea mays TaxID=4577 RepID=B6TYM4_MAIZE|nr:C2 domain containing protein [Zea mays]